MVYTLISKNHIYKCTYLRFLSFFQDGLLFELKNYDDEKLRLQDKVFSANQSPSHFILSDELTLVFVLLLGANKLVNPIWLKQGQYY